MVGEFSIGLGALIVGARPPDRPHGDHGVPQAQQAGALARWATASTILRHRSVGAPHDCR